MNPLSLATMHNWTSDSHSGDSGKFRRMLVLDPQVFCEADPESARAFVDDLSAIRRETVLVALGSKLPPNVLLPQPDYFISEHGAQIIREPGSERLEGWPHKDAKQEESQAILHLAHALMIPESSVHVVAGPEHTDALKASPSPVAVGSQTQSIGQSTSEVPANNTGDVNQALRQLQVFPAPAQKIGSACELGFRKAIEAVRLNVCEKGFTAASLQHNKLGEHDANYAAVWARDGVITGLWTLCLKDDEFNRCFRNTLSTLADHQTPSGQIPANVRIKNNSAEYAGLGGIASIDAVLWFVIGVARYSFACKDREFADAQLPAVQRAMTWLAAHDSNNDGLLEIPEASDWMDLFPRSYNVLHEEVLWYQACLDYAALLEARGQDAGHWKELGQRVKERILELFWPSGKLLMEQAGSSSGRFSTGEGHYLLSHVTPFDYSWRCDVGANLLAALTNILDQEKSERLFTFLWGVGANSPYPVKCLYPSVQSGADDWKDYFVVNFLNLPDHYHNGGIWPFLGGLWVRFLHRSGRTELALRELAELAENNRQGIHEEWEFNEWMHGRTGRPMGKRYQAWSAASYIKAYMTLTDESIPAEFDPLDLDRLR